LAEFIYTMRKARKAHGDKVILDDVTLAFYPAPRSVWSGPTAPASRPCSRSWPGWTTRPTATRSCRPGYSVGILEQEPRSTRQDVLGNVEEGIGAIKAKVDRFNEIAELMATDYSDDS
jgi:hypothetical protein